MDFKEDIVEKEDYYAGIKNNNSYNRIHDVKKIFRVIRDTANRIKNEYSIKVFYATNLKEDSDKKNDSSLYSCVWILSKKSALAKIDNKKIYFRNELSSELDKILSMGCSALVVTKNGIGIIIDPSYRSEYLEKFDILTSNQDETNIDCYLFNDELRNAVYALADYIKSNVANIDTLSEDFLIELLLDYMDNKNKKK